MRRAGPRQRVTGSIEWIRTDLGDDSHDHVIPAETRARCSGPRSNAGRTLCRAPSRPATHGVAGETSAPSPAPRARSVCRARGCHARPTQTLIAATASGFVYPARLRDRSCCVLRRARPLPSGPLTGAILRPERQSRPGNPQVHAFGESGVGTGVTWLVPRRRRLVDIVRAASSGAMNVTAGRLAVQVAASCATSQSGWRPGRCESASRAGASMHDT